MPTTESVIRDTSTHTPFRRAYIKRRDLTTGLYESTWQQVTQYVETWGRIEAAIDDVRVNRFVASGLDIVFNNKEGKFNTESDYSSLWFGYLPRYRTLLKIEAGYRYRGVEYPTDPTIGVFIMDGEITSDVRSNREIFSCRSIVAPFIDTRAEEIDGITDGSLTSSEIIAKIRDATDGSAGLLFRNFITSTAWSIQSTTQIMTGLNTTTAISDMTVWDLMVKLAESEGFVIYPSLVGGISFSDRTPNTVSAQHLLFGGKFPRPNILSLNTVREPREKLFTHVRIKFLPEDTETSYVSYGDPIVVAGSNVSWVFGRQTYEFENEWFGTIGANLIVPIIWGEFSQLKTECDIDAKLMPQVEILDHVSVSYREYDITSTHRLWAGDGASGGEAWASDLASAITDGLSWDDESGTSIDWWSKSFKVLKRVHDLDNMRTFFTLREV